MATNPGSYVGRCWGCQRVIREYERDTRNERAIVCCRCVEHDEHWYDPPEPTEDQLEAKRRDRRASLR